MEPYWEPCRRKEYAKGAGKDPWKGLIPVAACISLQERDDRFESATSEFQRVGLDDRVFFYRPPRDETPGARKPALRGCWESHRAVAAWAYRNGYPAVAVFEDDVTFLRPLKRRDIRRARDAFRGLPNRWNMMFLGHAPIFAWPTKRNDRDDGYVLWRAFSAYRHAYIMSRRMMRWLVERPYDETVERFRMLHAREWLGIDMFTTFLPGVYAVYPMLCFQSEESPGDNRQRSRFFDRFRMRPRTLRRVEPFMMGYLLFVALFAGSAVGFRRLFSGFRPADQ